MRGRGVGGGFHQEAGKEMRKMERIEDFDASTRSILSKKLNPLGGCHVARFLECALGLSGIERQVNPCATCLAGSALFEAETPLTEPPLTTPRRSYSYPQIGFVQHPSTAVASPWLPKRP